MRHFAKIFTVFMGGLADILLIKGVDALRWPITGYPVGCAPLFARINPMFAPFLVVSLKHVLREHMQYKTLVFSYSREV